MYRELLTGNIELKRKSVFSSRCTPLENATKRNNRGHLSVSERLICANPKSATESNVQLYTADTKEYMQITRDCLGRSTQSVDLTAIVQRQLGRMNSFNARMDWKLLAPALSKVCVHMQMAAARRRFGSFASKQASWKVCTIHSKGMAESTVSFVCRAVKCSKELSISPCDL